MAKIKISKHYTINKEIVNELSLRKGNYNSETEAVEHYLKLGMNAEDKKNNTELAILEINACLKEIRYVKNLLEQLFTNMKYPKNKDVSKDDALKEFKKDIFKNKFNE